VTADERLTEVFDRGLREGVEALSPADRELFRIQDFILEYEMNGLSGYFYNRLPDLGEISAAVDAMRTHELRELAALLSEAARLFAGYADPDPPTTWGEAVTADSDESDSGYADPDPPTTWCEVLRRYDPTDRLSDLESRIGALDNYGLGESSIAE
jgi:hypothetical protein